MTTEAFNQRGYERQKLLTGLVREADEWAEQYAERRIELGDLVLVIVDWLMTETSTRFKLSRLNPHHIVSGGLFFEKQVLPKVSSFARSPTEQLALLVLFIKELTKSSLDYHLFDLSKEELADPERIFHAPSAMTEVPIQE